MQVRLRALEPEDLDLLYRIENDMQLWSVGATNVPYSRYTLHSYVAESTGDIYADRQVRLIVERSDGQAVGIADLVNFEPAHLRAEVGIVIEQPFRGQGYARQAIVQLQHYARQVLHLHQLYGVIAADNEAALSLFRSLGYEQTGTLRHWLCHGNTYSDAHTLQLILDI